MSSRNTVDADIDALLDAGNLNTERPYIRLWAAVFHRGILDYREHIARRRLDSRVASWFSDKRHYPGSLPWLCNLFNIDIDWLYRNITPSQPTRKGQNNEIQ